MKLMDSRAGRLLGATLLIAGAIGWLSCAACATNSPRDENSENSPATKPDWLRTGEHAEYPKQSYITGVGTGNSRRGAYASALSEIVFQIKSDIDVSYKNKTVQRVETGSDQETQVSRDRKAVQDIELKSSFKAADLVEMAEVHRDEGGTYHAFAVLEQSRARRHAQRKYREVVDEHASFAEKSGERLGEMDVRQVAGVVSRLRKALEELQRAEMMIHTFDGQVPSSAPLTGVLERAQRRLHEYRRRVHVQICTQITGSVGGETAESYLRRKVNDWFSARGVDTSACSAASSTTGARVMRLRVDGNCECDQADEIQAITMCRTFADLTLERVDESANIASGSLGGETSREGHRNAEQAIRNSMDHVIEQITEEHLTGVFGP